MEYFLENYSPRIINKKMRGMLLDHLQKDLPRCHPNNVNACLSHFSALFDLLEVAAEESRDWKICRRRI